MAKKLFFETNEFKKLNSEWQDKLEKSGFKDIEKGETETVIRPEIIKTEKRQYHGGPDYFELCQTILRECSFRKEIHRLIFSKHTEGLSEREISQWLINNGHGKFSQKGINLVINRAKENYLKGVK